MCTHKRIVFFMIYFFSALSLQLFAQSMPLSVLYPPHVYPGDPLFVTTTSSPNIKDVPSMRVEVKSAKRIEGRSSFFVLPTGEAQAVVPLSTFLSAGEYVLAVYYKNDIFEYPLKIVEKEFISETIVLNESNTAIRTDSSPVKIKQINRLNEILFTVQSDSVWETGSFMLPVTSKRRTSFFGDRRVFAYSDGKKDTTLHYGIDFGVPTGTSVFASGQGRVVLAENRLSTGWSVVIEHLPGVYSLYYHMDSLLVTEGEMVQKGTLIGKSGSTGLATGPHLHWEVRVNGEAVNGDFFVKQ